jgi:transposase-like protein
MSEKLLPWSFSREFKLAAVARMDAGEKVARVARELGVSRKSLYQWRDQLRESGARMSGRRGRSSTACDGSPDAR